MNKITFSALIFCISISLFAQNPEESPITLEKISDNLYQVLGGRGANCGMYIGDNEVVIIDSKMDKASVDGIIAAVKDVTDKPITMVINTHSDGDHVNGNKFFPESVTIIAHENCRKDFFLPQRSGEPSTWLNDDMLPFVPKITFSDQMKIHLGKRVIELHYFGVGHTTGDAVVYFPEEKTAFIGDQVFFGRAQLIHSHKGGNSFEHVKTTKKILKNLDAEKFCSGHASVKTRANIEQHLKKFTAFQEKIEKLVNEGKTIEEVQSQFSEDETRLVTSIFNELKEK